MCRWNIKLHNWHCEHNAKCADELSSCIIGIVSTMPNMQMNYQVAQLALWAPWKLISNTTMPNVQMNYSWECHIAHLALCTMPFMSTAHFALCHYIRPRADLTMPIMQYSIDQSVMHIWHCAQCHLCLLHIWHCAITCGLAQISHVNLICSSV